MLLQKYHNLSAPKKHFLHLFGLYVFLIGLFSILVKLTVRQIGSDDTVFQEMIKPYPNLIDWLVYRYETWSGRIFPEAFVYLFSSAPLYAWKILSVFFYAIFVAALFAYHRLFSLDPSKTKDYLMLIIATCIPLLLQTHVLFDGTFWVTGAMNYAWVAAIGLVAFYPIAYIMRYRKIPRIVVTIFSVISLVIAASSSEQFGAILVTMSVLFSIYLLWKYRPRVRKELTVILYAIGYTVISLLSFSFAILAPGNKKRVIAEANHWQPDFYTTPILQHAEYAYRWLLEAFVNHTGFLLIGCVLIMAILLYVSKNKTRLDIVIASILGVASLFMLTKGYDAVNFWFSYYSTWKPILPNKSAYAALVPWVIVLPVIFIAPIRVFKKDGRGILIALLLCAAFAATLVIVASPTMYVSGWRTMYMPSVTLGVAFYLLTSILLDRFWKHKLLILWAIISLAGVQYTFILLKLLQNHL